MQKRYSFTLAAALAAGAFAFVGYDSSLLAQDASRPGASGSASLSTSGSSAHASGKMNMPQGITISSQSMDRQGIQKTLGQVVEAALQDSQLNQLSRQLASSDQNRLNNFDQQAQQYKQTLQQFRQAWKQKYNSDFDLREEVVFGQQWQGFEIVQGEVTNPALLSNWPVQASGSASTGPQSQSQSQFRSESDATRTQIRTETERSTTPGADATIRTETPRDPATPGTRAEPGRPGEPRVDLTPGRSETGRAGSSSGSAASTSSDASDRATVSGPGDPGSRVTPDGASASGSVSTGRTATGTGSTTITERSSTTSGQSSTPSASGSISSQSSGISASGSASAQPSGAGVSGSTSSQSSGLSSSGTSTSSLDRTSTTSSGVAGASGRASMIDRGAQVAVVTLPASHGAPELHVSLVRDSGMSSGASGAQSTDRPGAGASAGVNIGGVGASANVGASDRGVSASGAAGSSAQGASGAAGTSSSGISAAGTAGQSSTATPAASGASAQASGQWRMDIPDHINGQQLAQNLDKHLKMVMDQQAQWPQDQAEAQRLVAHHVLAAFYDSGMNAGAARDSQFQGTIRSNTDSATIRSNASVGGDREIRRDTTTRTEVKTDADRTAQPKRENPAPGDRAEPGRPGEPRVELTPNKPGEAAGTQQPQTNRRDD